MSVALPVTFNGFANDSQLVSIDVTPDSSAERYAISAGGFSTNLVVGFGGVLAGLLGNQEREREQLRPRFGKCQVRRQVRSRRQRGSRAELSQQPARRRQTQR